ncbi:MAG: agmatinase [Thermosulfidibacteraceae bacterium]
MKFLGAKHKGDIKIIGVPLDATVSYRPGTRFAYSEVVKASVAIETYSPYLELDLEDFDFEDMGEVELPFGNVEKSFGIIEGIVRELSAFPFLAIGGEHLITYPILKVLKDRFEDLVVLHLDAHLDMRDEYLGERLSHATVMRRVAELGISILSMGVRSFIREEIQFVKSSEVVEISPFKFDIGLLERLKGRNVYISFDSDVLDPSYLPGVGTPEPNGVSIGDVIDLIVSLSKLDLKIVGIDFVEVNPMIDSTGNTPIIASFIVRELLLLLAKNYYSR